uniref:Uncharacterized protein n=1 Tax=Strongyloides venezuelensis TaxID=75913 RepID=A0A0K0FE68_STRVS
MNTEYKVSENSKCSKNDCISIETSFDINTFNQTTFIIKTPAQNSNPRTPIVNDNPSNDNHQSVSGCDFESNDDISCQAFFPISDIIIKNKEKRIKDDNNLEESDNDVYKRGEKTLSSKFYIGEEYDEDTCVSANITLHTSLASSSHNTIKNYSTNNNNESLDSTSKSSIICYEIFIYFLPLTFYNFSKKKSLHGKNIH